jgi:predicted PurR-regulated permease PerM
MSAQGILAPFRRIDSHVDAGEEPLKPRTDLAIQAFVVTLVVATTYGLLSLLLRLQSLLIVILIAAILAAGLGPLVARLANAPITRRRRLGKGGAILVVVLGIGLFFLLIATLLVTPLVQQATTLAENFPRYVNESDAWLRQLRARLRFLPDVTRWLARLPEELQNLSQYLGTAASVFTQLANAVATGIMLIVIIVYMLIEGPSVKKSFLRLWPVDRRPLVTSVLERIGGKFSGWLRGTAILAFGVFVMSSAGLLALGMPYPFLLGTFAGLMEMVPSIGPFVGAAPAVVVSLFQPTWRIVGVILLFTIIMQFELNFMVPRVMGRAVGLSPLLAIISVLIGGGLLGIMGVLLAIPIAAALQVIASEIVPALLPHTSHDKNLPQDP